MFFFTLSNEKNRPLGGFSGFFYFAGANIIHQGAKCKFRLTFVYIWSCKPFFPINAKREATPLPFAPYTVLPYTYKIKLRAADFFLAIFGIFSDFRPEICNFAAGIINP